MFGIRRSLLALVLALGYAMNFIVACSSDSDQAPADPIRILVTNDDGVSAEGIDALVEALRDDPGIVLTVSAPSENQSGRGDSTTPTPPPLQATQTTTASGYPATAVDGTPADSVIYALDSLFADAPPHVVLSGVNEGQNVGAIPNGQLLLLSGISGTVGAAKTAACLGVPALASSQGDVAGDGTLDYDAGVAAVLAWLQSNRASLVAGNVSVDNITSINIPSCETGSIRDTLEVPLATENPNEWLIIGGSQDCESTVTAPPNDVEAFFNGYVAVSPVASNALMTCDKLN